MSSRSSRPMRIAFLGTRGIPANYGGFETFTEEVSVRLASRGHQVTVYCRAHNGSADLRTFRGVDLVQLPAIRNKYMETFSHTLFSAVHALFRQFDITYVCNSANAPICFIPWMRRQRTILNVDGLEWRRAEVEPAREALLALGGQAGGADADRSGDRCARDPGLLRHPS